jgi:hypothetical protein
MKKRIKNPVVVFRVAFLLLGLGFHSLLLAQQPMLWCIEPARAEADAAGINKNIPELSVGRNLAQIQHCSFLFGTIHLPDPRVTRLYPVVETAFQRSAAVYTEVPLEAEDIDAQMHYFFLPETQNLSELLSASLRKRSHAVLKQIDPQLSIDAVERMKIWAFATALPQLQQQLRYPGIAPLDMQLYQRALREGKRTGGLETYQEQLGLFDDLSLSQQRKLLSDTLLVLENAMKNAEDINEELIRWYLQGDADSFSQLMEKWGDYSDPAYDGLQEKLIDQRNQRMAKRIAVLLQKHPREQLFFAVGSGHFAGDEAIQRLLKKQGFRVFKVSE